MVSVRVAFSVNKGESHSHDHIWVEQKKMYVGISFSVTVDNIDTLAMLSDLSL